MPERFAPGVVSSGEDYTHSLSITHQTLSPDGLRLWFSSRRPLNDDAARAAIQATESDLFYVDWKDGHWNDGPAAGRLRPVG